VRKFLIFAVVAMLLLVGVVIDAFAGEVEKTLLHDLSECARIVKRIADRTGTPTADDIARLKQCAEAIHADRLLLSERQGALAERTAALGGKAADRQDAVFSTLLKNLDDLLSRLDAIDATVTPSDLDSLKQQLDILVPHKSRPLLGVLPYRHMNYPPREPALSPVIKPAYKGGDRNVYAADTSTTSEAPISKEIADLAQSLQWNPVLIYEWVKNNVETEWYWGSMKGAEETLRQKSGNDADQAALLVALLRSAGFPSRYIKGTIEFFPDMEKAKNLIGLDDPAKVYTFLQKAGIPVKPVIAGGTIANFQIEHIWVESFIPYANYRGAVLDDQGKIWLGLDTSVKPLGYTRAKGAGVPADILSTLRDDYLNAVQTVTPLDYLKSKLDASLATTQPDKNWSSLKDSATLIPDIQKIIPAGLQFPQIAITGEYQALPDELKHKVAFTATANGNELFSLTLDAQKLSNRKIALRAEPETLEDQNLIDSFGGLDSIPAYLVRLRPVLTLDKERLIVAQDGLPMGADYTLNIDVITPNGTERVSSGQINGNLSVIGVVGQKAVAQAAISESDDAESILFKVTTDYIDRWNRSEGDLAALLGQSVSRPTISIAMVGAQLEVTQMMDTPYDMQWKGLFLDASYRRIETVGRNGSERDFMRLSSLQGSILENRVFEDDLKVDSISTAKVIQLANTSAIPLIAIDKTSIDTLLSTLPFDDAVKADISNAVNQGLTVTIPQAEIAYQDWTGIGYIKEDPATGESGWMLTGQVAGGMTAWTPGKWDVADLKAISIALRTPLSGKPNDNPKQAAYIVKIPITDQQIGTVGSQVPKKLQVKVVDRKGRQILGAVVTFRIKAGGGSFNGGLKVVTQPTDEKGLASVNFTLGSKTSDNPVYWQKEGNLYSDQYGANIIDASVDNGIAIDAPFTIFGKPGPLYKLTPTYGANISSVILSYAGFVSLIAEDKSGNPIANQKVTFKLGKTKVTGVCKNKSYDTTPALLVKGGDNCMNTPLTISSAGSCKKAAATITDTTSLYGAWAGVILGGAPGATYPVVATVGDLTTEYSPSSYDFSRCSESATQLIVDSVFPADRYGHSINAARSGTAISIIAKEYLLKEGETTVSMNLTCDASTLSCSHIVGDHTYNTVTNFVTSKVFFNKIPADDLGNGLFQGFYTLKPGRNTITIEGNATYGFNRLYNSCTTGCANKITTEDRTLKSTTTIQAYGVDIAIQKPLNIMLDGLGLSRNNLKIKYTIYPADYRASNAFILLYKVTGDGDQKTYDLIDNITVEKQGSGYGVLARGYRFDEKQKYAVRVALNYGSYAQIMSDPEPITIAKGALIPDYNHNRKIDDDDRDRALNNDPYYFWVNDDDGKDDTKGSGIPGSGNLKWNRDNINGTRDLVDFFPVYLDIEKMKKTYPPSDFTYKLHNETSSLNIVETSLKPDTSGDYLTDMPTVQLLAKAQKTMVINDGYTLSERILNGNGIILLEGWQETTKPLKLAVYDKTGNKMDDIQMNLSIAGVEQMFRHKNLISVAKSGNGPVPAPNSESGGEPDRFIAPDDSPTNLPDSECNIGTNIVAVHGYNVNGQEARGFHAEMFKRLYWSGSKARFWGVSWYGSETKLANVFTPDYHTNVVNAFDTAPALRDFLINSVVGDVTIMAHSLGNMVVSSMLSDNTSPLTRIKNYFMIDAAVALEAYDGGASQSKDMVHNDWADYKPSLWMSEWHQLFVKFDPQDSRSKLTWRDKFKARPTNTNYYNFYSSGEEVLGVLPLNTPVTQIFVDNMNQTGSYAWAIQEKLKGGNPIPVDFVDNSRGGWGFNLEDYAEKDPYGRNTSKPISFFLANDIPDADLKMKPFFKKGSETDLYELGAIGSTYAKNNMNRLLANAMPARTLPAGANKVNAIDPERNLDMQLVFKNDNKDWPADRGKLKNWRHSDLKNVAYPFIYLMFDNIVTLGGLSK